MTNKTKVAEMAVWEKVAKSGAKYLSGSITLTENMVVGQKINVTGFYQEPAEGSNKPVIKFIVERAE